MVGLLRHYKRSPSTFFFSFSVVVLLLLYFPTGCWYLLLDVDIFFLSLPDYSSCPATPTSKRKAIWKDDVVGKKNHGENLARWAPFFFWRFLEHVREYFFYTFSPLKKEKKRTNWYSLSLVSLFSRWIRRRKDSSKSTTNFAWKILIWTMPQSVRPWISIWAWWCSIYIYIYKMKKKSKRGSKKRWKQK